MVSVSKVVLTDSTTIFIENGSAVRGIRVINFKKSESLSRSTVMSDLSSPLMKDTHVKSEIPK